MKKARRDSQTILGISCKLRQVELMNTHYRAMQFEIRKIIRIIVIVRRFIERLALPVVDSSNEIAAKRRLYRNW